LKKFKYLLKKTAASTDGGSPPQQVRLLLSLFIGGGETFHSASQPNLPDCTIYDIPYLRKNKKIQLLDLGILDIKDVPADFPLNDKQRLIIEVTGTNQEHIDREAIQAEFQRFVYPLYFLDTNMAVVVVSFTGC